MADSPDSLGSSLHRSLVLGLEVLERASKHRVDWTQAGTAGHRLSHTVSEETEQAPAQREQQSSAEDLRAAFSSIAGFMRQTSAHCQRFHGSVSSLSEPEQPHVWRFHRSPGQSGLRSRTQVCPKRAEDFHIHVSPGTYSVTASDPESPRQRAPLPSPQQQTQLVSLGDGESVVLTFDL